MARVCRASTRLRKERSRLSTFPGGPTSIIRNVVQAVLKTRPAPGFQIEEVAGREPGDGEVLLRVAAASICGTDVHLYDWNPWAAGRVHLPRIVGHEMGGEVLATGMGVEGLARGDLVAVESHVVCGTCPECRRGDFHVCRNTRILGVDIDGVFSATVVLPGANLHPVTGLSAELCALMEPFGNAVHACATGSLRDAAVAVLGCGPIGCAAVAIARAEGARVIVAADLNPYRLELAERMGADEVVRADDLLEASLLRAAGGPLDCALEMSGAAPAVAAAIRVVRPGGWISLLGIGDQEVSLDLNRDVVMKGLTLQGIVGRRSASWSATLAYVAGGRVDASPLLTHRFALDEIDGAIELIKSGRCGKVVLVPDPQ
ncbi:MAG: L-threonine 3-dehydrogenase [Candidatus Dormibacteria bacterium]